MVIDYSVAGPLTGLGTVPAEVLATDAADPVGICTPVRALVVQPADPTTGLLPPQRLATNQIRPAAELITSILTVKSAPLTVPREPEDRIVGTCRHFAVIACALLRHRGIPARVRCGFATYFQPGRAVDHWIIEFREGEAGRWIRLDPEVLGLDVVSDSADLTGQQFLTGGEAWQAYRAGRIDADTFGVHGTENWGPAEIRGNAVKDLAALNKVELLPWDEWGRMTDAYNGATGTDYDDQLDRLADACASDDLAAIADQYSHPDLRVPSRLIY